MSAALCASAGLSAAQIRAFDRIVRKPEARSTFALKGNVHPFTKSGRDRGRVGGLFKMERVTMMLKPSDAQQAGLDKLVEEQQDPSSPNYHKWLTPEEFSDRFGLSANDVNQVVDWLQSQGLTVDEVARTRRWISFSGPAQQVESAFQTSIHEYVIDGETFYANATEPAVPAALAGVVSGFRSLNNFRMKPRPRFTSSLSGNHFIAPNDFATIYDLGSLYANGFDGTGQKIAIVGQTDILVSDIRSFRAAAGLPPSDPITVLVPGSTDPGIVTGDVQEASLDIEWSGAVARNAQIVYVNSKNGVFDSLQYAVDQHLAPVISMSYGSCEKNFTPQDAGLISLLAQQANAQGITILAASGDTGAADCDSQSSTIAKLGLAVDIPASIPYITALGGTEFHETTTSWNPTNDASNSSAISYIPEIAWNDSGTTQLSAGGGGRSIYFSKPSWQTGVGVPNDSVRDVPDVSLDSSGAHDGYLMCSQGSCVNGFRSSTGGLTVVGGTSVAAPAFAGIVAIINQVTNAPQGNINPKLYSLAATAPAAFHDITSGGNQVPCQAGTTDCPFGGSIGYVAGPGYDQATGLGSVDAANLVAAWTGRTTAVTTNPTPSPAPASAPMPVITGVSPASGAQGTTVSIVLNGFNLTGGSVVFGGTGITVTPQPGATDTQIPLSVIIAPDALLGAQSVTVSTAGGSVAAASAFTVQPQQLPATAPQPISVVEQGTVRTGYAIITPNANSSAPVATVTFGTVSGGVVTSQGGILPIPMMTDAGMFVDVLKGIGRDLGVVIANPSSTQNPITLTLRDQAGSVVGNPFTFLLQAQQQTSKFVSDIFPSVTSFRGTIEIQSSAPFGVLGVRFSGLEFSTLPITGNSVSTGVPVRSLSTGVVGGSGAIIVPEFAMGGGYATQFALVNPTSTVAQGRIDIFDTAGNPMQVTMNDVTQSSFSYAIAPAGVFMLAPRDANGQSPF